jgi:hypothetical protein
MNPEQVKARTMEKKAEIMALCDKLMITLSAEEILSNNRIVKVVYFHDNEDYPNA